MLVMRTRCGHQCSCHLVGISCAGVGRLIICDGVSLCRLLPVFPGNQSLSVVRLGSVFSLLFIRPTSRSYIPCRRCRSNEPAPASNDRSSSPLLRHIASRGPTGPVEADDDTATAPDVAVSSCATLCCRCRPCITITASKSPLSRPTRSLRSTRLPHRLRVPRLSLSARESGSKS